MHAGLVEPEAFDEIGQVVVNYDGVKCFEMDLQRGFERSVSDTSPQFALNPIFAFAFNDRGISFIAKGDLDRGIADYDQAVKINPTFATACVSVTVGPAACTCPWTWYGGVYGSARPMR